MTVGEIKEELETLKKLRGELHKLEEEGQFQKKHVQSIIFDRKFNWTLFNFDNKHFYFNLRY